MEHHPGYLGILKWSLGQMDGTRPSEFRPMSEEVRRQCGIQAKLCSPFHVAAECSVGKFASLSTIRHALHATSTYHAAGQEVADGGA